MSTDRRHACQLCSSAHASEFCSLTRTRVPHNIRRGQASISSAIGNAPNRDPAPWQPSSFRLN
jgi:hypothetical protein